MQGHVLYLSSREDIQLISPGMLLLGKRIATRETKRIKIIKTTKQDKGLSIFCYV